MNRPSDEDVGGACGEQSMARGSRMTQPLVYRSNVDSPASRKQEFEALVREIARKLAPYAVTAKEKDAVWDAQREVPRLSLAALDLLLDVAARADKPFLVEDAIKGSVIQRMASPKPLYHVDTFLDETRKQAEGDTKRIHFHVERTPVRRDQALDALGMHKHAIEQDMAALWQWNPARSA